MYVVRIGLYRTSNEVNAAILKAYTDEVKVPTLVAVDHGKVRVYTVEVES